MLGHLISELPQDGSREVLRQRANFTGGDLGRLNFLGDRQAEPVGKLAVDNDRPKRQILDAIWGTDFVAESNIVDRHVRTLRMKLHDDYRHSRFIATVTGEGYRFLAGPAQPVIEAGGGPGAVGRCRARCPRR